MTSHSTDLIARARAVQSRIAQLRAISDEPGALTRLFLSPSHGRANQALLGWIRDAGMRGRIDAVGNVIGELSGRSNTNAALMLGSHIDTVRHAGRYDGSLGVLVALDCLEHLVRRKEPPAFPIHLIAFGDEEGVRFGSTVLGSRAAAGLTTAVDLERRDREGISVGDAMVAAGLDPGSVPQASLAGNPPAAYVELHIEQGPILDNAGESLACVTAITGSHRLMVEIVGMSGHAGTVPMNGRRDALTAAAESICVIEKLCHRLGIVGTVGFVETHPNAGNVIPGRVRFSIDIRDQRDDLLNFARSEIEEEIGHICARRHVMHEIQATGGSRATVCDARLTDLMDTAIAPRGVRRLPSGAGHDGIAMSELCPIAMMFVRCAGGVSHHPDESVADDDIAAAIGALDRFIELYARDRADATPSAGGGH